MKIAIQGQQTSFHDQAARNFFGDDIELFPCESFRDVFLALENDDADYAVVANENSLYGSINEVDIELMDANVWIMGEVDLPIELQLAGLPGTKLTDITDVISQREALAQCQKWLHQNTDVRSHNYHDTAASAKKVKQDGNSKQAAICTRAAADHHDLSVIAKSIQDQSSFTRFLVLSKTKEHNPNANKTSVTVQIKHAAESGSLLGVLKTFASHNINLTKLVSRPVPGTKWEYMFFIDFKSGTQEQDTKKTLQELKDHGHLIKILGSYEADHLPVYSCHLGLQ